MWYVVCGMLCVLCVCARALCSVRVRECVFVWGAALYATDVIYNHITKKELIPKKECTVYPVRTSSPEFPPGGVARGVARAVFDVLKL